MTDVLLRLLAIEVRIMTMQIMLMSHNGTWHQRWQKHVE